MAERQISYSAVTVTRATRRPACLPVRWLLCLLATQAPLVLAFSQVWCPDFTILGVCHSLPINALMLQVAKVSFCCL